MQLRLPTGDSVTVLQQGAQIVSWCTADGVEHVYLSECAVLNGQTPIRGGVPVCFPQFNMRGPLIKHGFARLLPWSVVSIHEHTVVFRLVDGPLSQAFWAHAFTLELTVYLQPNALQMDLKVGNTDACEWSFTAALHTYLKVGDIAQVQLQGLHGVQGWNAIADQHFTQEGAVLFDQAVDCVYQAQAQSAKEAPHKGDGVKHNASNALDAVQCLLLKDDSPSAPPGELIIEQSPSFEQTVVWNPGEQLAQTLQDLPANGWRNMVCVEAAMIDNAVHLRAGEHWQGRQTLRWKAADA